MLGRRRRDLGHDDLVAWLAERAIPIDLAAGGPHPAWSALDALADRSRVAYLAESHHFIHEKYAFRRSAIAWLAARGWRWFGEELGWTDGLRVDQGALDRVPTYGYEGVRRTDRSDRPWGILAAGDAAFPQEAFRDAQQAFHRSIRAISDDLRWFGFDVDGWTTAGLEVLRELVPSHPEVAAVVAGLEQVPGESLTAEADRAAAVLAAAPPLPAVAARTLDALATTLRYAAEAYPAATWEDLRPPMATREQLMWRHVDAVLDDPALAGPDRKVALQAGSLHLLKDDDAIHDETPGIGPGGGRVPSVGHHVAHRADIGADRVLAIWMLCGRGHDANTLVPGQAGIAPRAGTLNAALDAASHGHPALVPLTDLPGAVRVQHMHDSVFRTPVAGQLDAVVYVPEVSPLA